MAETWEELDLWKAEQGRDKTPAWYTPTLQRQTQNRNAGRGKHPMGLELADNGETCGSCNHCTKKEIRSHRRFLKCDLVRNTSGAATDIRAKWGACVKWEPA